MFFTDREREKQSWHRRAPLFIGQRRHVDIPVYALAQGGNRWRERREYWGADATAAWDRNGNAYASFSLWSQASAYGGALAIARLAPGSTTWTEFAVPANSLGTGDGVYYDHPGLAINTVSSTYPNRKYIVASVGKYIASPYSYTQSVQVFYSDATGSGSTSWATVKDIGKTANCPVAGTCFDTVPSISVGPNGYVYIVWKRITTDTAGYQIAESTQFSYSTNSGVTWSTPAILAQHDLLSFGRSNSPEGYDKRRYVPPQDYWGISTAGSVDVDRNANSPFYNRVYFSYSDFATSNATTDVDVYVKYIDASQLKSDGTTQFKGPTRINDDIGTATQFFPFVTVDQTDGTVNAAWYDSRNFSPDFRKTQVYYARSSTGAASFEPNVLMTLAGATGFVNDVNYLDINSIDVGKLTPVSQYADNMGLAAANRQAHAVWTDSRNLYPVAMNATQSTDAATASIINCSAPNSTRIRRTQCNSTSGIYVSWRPVLQDNWGIGAPTNNNPGNYELYRYTDADCTQNEVLLDDDIWWNMPNYLDATAVKGTQYYYRLDQTNNCPGTELTGMSTKGVCTKAVFCQ